MKLIRSILPMAAAGLFFSNQAKAQFKPGTVMLGTTVGSIGYSDANSDYGYDIGGSRSTGTKTFTFSMGPQVGVFVTPNLIFGGNLNYSINHSTANTTNTSATSALTGSKTTTTTNTFSIGPLVRYYFAGLTGKNWFYGQVSGAVGTGTGTSSGSSYSTTTTTSTSGKVDGIFNWNAGASVGMTHFFYKRIGMDFAIGYNYSHAHSNNDNNTTTTKTTGGTTSAAANNYSLNTGTNGLTLSVGFHWFI